MHSLFKNIKIVRLLPDNSGYQVSTGQAANTSNSIDTEGYDGAAFLLGKGTGTAANVVAIKLQQSSDNGSVDTVADVVGATVTLTDIAGSMASKMAGISLYKPAERYLKAVTTTSVQNSAIDFLIVILYRGHYRPITQLLTTGQFGAAPVELNNVTTA